MSEAKSEATPKHVEATTGATASNAQPSTSNSSAANVHRSPQKRQNNPNPNHNHNPNHNANHNSKSSVNSGGGGGGGGGRKRRYTVGASDVFRSYQKRRRLKDDFEPPTVFKLGGNIHDPLNLNGITGNGQTPVSSPFPSPFPQHPQPPPSRMEKLEVLIPPNIYDPLNLSGPNELHESDLISLRQYNHSQGSRYSRRNKRRRTSSETDAAASKMQQPPRSSALILENPSLLDSSSAPASTSISTIAQNQQQHQQHQQNPNQQANNNANQNKKKNKERFRYGNYNRYYGYRNSRHNDRRLELFPRDLFQGKDILDVGCNIGHVTLTLARDYGPRRIVGVDIDEGLIEVAKKNIRHYITEKVVQQEEMPISMPLLYGPLANVPKQAQQNEEEGNSAGNVFPNNVFFLSLNYVPESDDLLELQEEEYDAIICLSLTKWIHLNWGDDGIRRLFQRAFRQLRPGGCLILEPQPWSSYQKKAKMTPQIQSTYRSIRFRPDQFNEYLLKDVGFKSCELLGTPENSSKGFQRSIYMYRKKAAVAAKSATASATASTSPSESTSTS